MKAPQGIVVAASVLVSSPVLWMVRAGTLSATEALQRWGICLALCWLAITCVSTLAFPGTGVTHPVPAEEEAGHSRAEL
ncbi:MAG: hypothetical protein JWR90_2571 [Marmoricola sp.]|nr:hypothetical protein [Marmoricola sp.]